MKRFVLLLLFATTPIAAQTPAAIEMELLGYLKTMSDNGTYGGQYDDEKLNAASDVLKRNLMRYATRTDVLKYAFPKLKEEMFIATSRDGRLRVYSWDLQSGGTMHDYDRMIQFVGASGKTIAWSDGEGDEYDGGGAFYTDVFHISSRGGPIYLLASTSRASTSLNGQSINAVKIKGDDFDPKANLIKTAGGMTNSIGFAYDFFTVSDRPGRPIRLFTFNEARREFRFPVVIEDEKTPQGRVTNKFITYRFNGTHFVKVGQ